MKHGGYIFCTLYVYIPSLSEIGVLGDKVTPWVREILKDMYYSYINCKLFPFISPNFQVDSSPFPSSRKHSCAFEQVCRYLTNLLE